MRRRPGIGGLQTAAAARVSIHLIDFPLVCCYCYVIFFVAEFNSFIYFWFFVVEILWKDQYRLLGENVAKIRTDLMKEQLATFRSHLEEFARKHKVEFM